MQNGRLTNAMLAPIPGGRLERHVAPYWNALVVEARRRFGITPRPGGPMSSYRTFAQQVYLWHLYLSGRGNLAARPGTSNHGLGQAVDLATTHMRWIVDRIGRRYGFAKSCSDAPSEWWHIKWNPACTHATWRPPHAVPLPTLYRGVKGHTTTIKRLQIVLRHRGHRVRITGRYDLPTRRAVRAIQKKYHLPVDPKTTCGPRTWRAILHR
jgi:peptidoglycan hydrolase-like protein with peptidoglycan-binding domain